MQVNIKQSDLLRITGKLSGIAMHPDNILRDVQLQWRLQILNHYKKAVQEAMGSVRARSGGYVRMSFMGLNGTEYWKKLHGKTIQFKEEVMSPYRFSIWADTGETKEAVEVHEDNFAGIWQKTNSNEWRKAIGNEFGETTALGVIPQRKLFSVANTIFVETLQRALRNENSPMANYLRAELVEKVFVGKFNWGRK